MLWRSWGQGGRAEVACRPRLMLLRSSHILSVLVRSMQSSGSGGGEECQAPTRLQQWFSASGSRLLSSCITTSVLSVQGQLVVNSRTRRPSAIRPQELNLWPGAAFWQDMGPMVIVFVHVIAAMFVNLVGESRRGESAEVEMRWASP